MPWGQAAAESRASGVPQACSFIAALSYPAQRPLERLLNQRRREVEGGLLSRNTAIRGAPTLLGTGMYVHRARGRGQAIPRLFSTLSHVRLLP